MLIANKTIVGYLVDHLRIIHVGVRGSRVVLVFYIVGLME